jgi:hypothetical protein
MLVLCDPVVAAGTCGQFFKTPDVLGWTNIRGEQFAINSDLSLSVGNTYFALLRVTFNHGKQVVASSDGVMVIAGKSDKLTHQASLIQEQQQQQQHQATPIRQRSTRAVAAINDACPIDEANRCRQLQKSVGQWLRETYGEPEYNPDSPIALLYLVGRLSDRARAGIFPDTPYTRQFQRDYEGVGLVGKTAAFGDALIPMASSSDDDDSGLAPGDAPAWVIAPIAVGIFLCGLCVFLALLLVILRRRYSDDGGGGSSTSRGGGNFAADADTTEKKQYAGRNVIGVTGTSDRTDISFPDTNIRRLSITHNDAAVDDLEEATRSPRRKHPIMQSTSSSFRDYRNNA